MVYIICFIRCFFLLILGFGIYSQRFIYISLLCAFWLFHYGFLLKCISYQNKWILIDALLFSLSSSTHAIYERYLFEHDSSSLFLSFDLALKNNTDCYAVFDPLMPFVFPLVFWINLLFNPNQLWFFLNSKYAIWVICILYIQLDLKYFVQYYFSVRGMNSFWWNIFQKWISLIALKSSSITVKGQIN